MRKAFDIRAIPDLDEHGNPNIDGYVDAILADPEMGSHTASCVNDFSGAELRESLIDFGVRTVRDALDKFRQVHRGGRNW